MRYIWILFFVLLPSWVVAEVYEHRDAEGNVTYSDQPSADAEKVELPPASVVRAADSTATIEEPAEPSGEYSTAPETPEEDQSVSGSAKSTAAYYKVFSMDAPTAEQTFQNQRSIPVEVLVEPELQEGDTVQFLLDGKAYGKPAGSASTILSNIDRGTHTVRAQLLDRQGNVVKSTKSVTIYVHYASVQ